MAGIVALQLIHAAGKIGGAAKPHAADAVFDSVAARDPKLWRQMREDLLDLGAAMALIGLIGRRRPEV